MFKSILKNRKSLAKQFSKVQLDDIKDDALRAKFKKLNGKQGGFTLLELLVVVAILAAIAGTAAIALQDTDARASAAAHVAMMDELNKGIRTFRVLNKNQLPNNLDSLVAGDTVAIDSPELLTVAAIEDVSILPIPVGVAAIMSDIGVTELQYVRKDGDPADDGTCADIQGLIASRGNAVVAGNIFMTPDGNGCGHAFDLYDEAGEALNGTPQGVFWTGGQERLLGQPTTLVEFDGTNLATATGTAFLATGLGPSSTLFNANELGGMTSVPVYRHVSETQYNRFIALWNVGTFDGAGAITAADQMSLAAIVDGAGDTKEEELGEWDGTRNTI